jgi:hypothetical protein
VSVVKFGSKGRSFGDLEAPVPPMALTAGDRWTSWGGVQEQKRG